jgi:hypothetical protein
MAPSSAPIPACVFAQMREHDPVVRQPGIDGETPIWFVTRHDDVAAVLLDDERFVRDPRNALSPEALEERNAAFALALEAIENHMLNRDGDDHRRLRRLVTKAFTPKRVGAAAAADPGHRRRAARRGGASRCDGSLGRLCVPAPDHRDRRAARSPRRRPDRFRSGRTRSSPRRSTRRTWSGSSSRWESSSAT